MTPIRALAFAAVAVVALQGGYCVSNPPLGPPPPPPAVRRYDVQGVLAVEVGASLQTAPRDYLDEVAIGPGGELYGLIRGIGVFGLAATGRRAAFPGAPDSQVGGDWAHTLSSGKGLAIDAEGGAYVATSQVIMRIAPDATLSRVAGMLDRPGGTDGVGEAARFEDAAALALGRDGTLYVAESQSGRIRAIAPDRTVTTLPPPPGATAGEIGDFWPIALALDSQDRLLVTSYSAIWRYGKDRTPTLLAGQPRAEGAAAAPVPPTPQPQGTAATTPPAMEAADGEGAAARFQDIRGLTVGADDVAYVIEGPLVDLPDTRAGFVGTDHLRLVSASGRTSTMRLTWPCAPQRSPTLWKLAFDGLDLVGVGGDPNARVRLSPAREPSPCPSPAGKS